MKRGSARGIIAGCILAGMGLIDALPASAAPFKNLDFEAGYSGVEPGSPQFRQPASIVFPGWTLRFNEQITTTAEFGIKILDAPDLVLNSRNFMARVDAGPVSGIFAAELISTFDFIANDYAVASIAQVGDVPASAQLIRFMTRTPAVPMTVTLNGAAIPLVEVSSSNGVSQLAGDVRSFAGATAELRFAAGIHPI
jgi:hypothetical protein